MADIRTWDEIFERMEKIVRREVDRALRELLNSPKIRGAFRKQTEILLKLEEMERQIQMNKDEAMEKLNNLQSSLSNISDDIDRLQVLIGELQNADLAPDLAAKVDELDTIASALKDKVPEPPPEP